MKVRRGRIHVAKCSNFAVRWPARVLSGIWTEGDEQIGVVGNTWDTTEVEHQVVDDSRAGIVAWVEADPDALSERVVADQQIGDRVVDVNSVRTWRLAVALKRRSKPIVLK